ncbi:putative ion transporter superfamily protein YfcC [Sinobaca qinghaiensis]|uniref:Putative ion transporter superfamily protein YfcC n=1 Tax=Sinobaca qinghaiensis TaxID=342944 RepID=A0A419V8I0_9BACL|nr:putative basic amino acid antiporter YfcC [Sinobaca qinghaiensis]RKD76268.1 putative ion transporter superfamily protein YfcC [Sinobaca qinghaiensis]
MPKKGIQMPHTFVIIFGVVVLAALMTYLIPMGIFETEEVTYDNQGQEDTRTVLMPETFQYETGETGEPLRDGVSLFEPFGEAGFLNYMFEGLVSGDKWGSAVGVVAFILIIGGAFGIIMRTKAIDQGILAVIDKTKGREALLIPVMFFIFSLGGAVFGMGEEAIAFAIILIPLVIALGYDAITGVMITYVATQIGFASSWMNPFGVAIVQGVSDVPVLSGAPFRIVMWIVFTGVGIAYTIWYASKVRRDPSKSYSPEANAYFKSQSNTQDISGKFKLGDALVVTTLGLGIVWIVWGVVRDAYYIPEIATQFFTIGLVAGVIGVLFKLNNMTVNDIAEGFSEGAQQLLPAALIVGMAKGIVIILGGDDPAAASVLNTILYSAGGLVDNMPEVVSASFILLFQSIINFFVVSGSGQAALTMPLIAPLSDIAGVTRQVAVLGFQLGDGLTNMIVPTSAALMGTLGAARVGWGTWFRFIFKFQLLMMGLALAFVIIAVLIDFS